MTKAVEAPFDTRIDSEPSTNGGHTADYREQAKKLAAEDYQARIRRFHSEKASHSIASWSARL